MADPNLAYQFSGPYVQTFMKTVQEHMDEYDPITEYFYTLNIDNASPNELVFIGLIVGYPWPSAPAGIFDDNVFVFGEQSEFPVIDNLTGFADLPSTIGGIFTSSDPAVGNLIPIALYRTLLKQVAFLKSNGLSLATIDQVCFVFSPDYTISVGNSAEGFFTLGDSATFPQTSTTQGLSGVNPPYNTQGGMLAFGNASDFQSDIFVVFNTQIGPGNLWVIQAIFDKFTTDPQVLVSQGS